MGSLPIAGSLGARTPFPEGAKMCNRHEHRSDCMTYRGYWLGLKASAALDI